MFFIQKSFQFTYLINCQRSALSDCLSFSIHTLRLTSNYWVVQDSIQIWQPHNMLAEPQRFQKCTPPGTSVVWLHSLIHVEEDFWRPQWPNRETTIAHPVENSKHCRCPLVHRARWLRPHHISDVRHGVLVGLQSFMHCRSKNPRKTSTLKNHLPFRQRTTPKLWWRLNVINILEHSYNARKYITLQLAFRTWWSFQSSIKWYFFIFTHKSTTIWLYCSNLEEWGQVSCFVIKNRCHYTALPGQLLLRRSAVYQMCFLQGSIKRMKVRRSTLIFTIHSNASFSNTCIIINI